MQTKQTLSPIGKRTKRQRVVSNIVKVLVVLVFLAALALGLWWIISYTYNTSSSSPPVSSENSTSVAPANLSFVDNNPEHIAQVLGSQEAYDKLVNSGLRRVKDIMGPDGKGLIMGKDDMCIIHDSSGVWVWVVMEGEIVDIDLNSKKLILKNGGDEIVLAISEFISMDRMIKKNAGPGQPPRYIPWEEFKVGDWLDLVEVAVNANRAEVRSVYIY